MQIGIFLNIIQVVVLQNGHAHEGHRYFEMGPKGTTGLDESCQSGILRHYSVLQWISGIGPALLLLVGQVGILAGLTASDSSSHVI